MEPPPEPCNPPVYHPVADGGPDPLLALGLVVAAVAGVIALIAGAAGSEQNQIAAIERDTATTEEITRRLEQAERDADEHIAKMRGDHHG